MSTLPQTTISLLKSQYHTYRHTPNPTLQSFHFSPTCLQICRPIPSYHATTRAQIIQYQKDAISASEMKAKDPLFKPLVGENIRGVYTIRPLTSAEASDFSTQEVTAEIVLSPEELARKAREEGWVGMRVDLWDEGVPIEGSLLVKVQYWWRWEDVAVGEGLEGDEEGMGWRQCLHDVVYIGERDGSEGEEGLEVRELGSTVG